MKIRNPFPTSKEQIALDLIMEWLGESRFNRSLDEYLSIARRLPKLEALHAYVNQRLAEIAKAEVAPFEICYCKSGDRYPWYEPFPTSLSKETVRSALVKSGFWALRKHGNLRSCFT
jgi:hypothetical protein